MQCCIQNCNASATHKLERIINPTHEKVIEFLCCEHGDAVKNSSFEEWTLDKV